jgi:hypothetical protein
MCRAAAAAVLGDPERVQFVDGPNEERFIALSNKTTHLHVGVSPTMKRNIIMVGTTD